MSVRFYYYFLYSILTIVYILRLVGYVTVFFSFFLIQFLFYIVQRYILWLSSQYKILFSYWLYIYTSSILFVNTFSFQFFFSYRHSVEFLPPPQKMPWVFLLAWKIIFNHSKNRILYLFYAEFLSLLTVWLYPFLLCYEIIAKIEKQKQTFRLVDL